MHLPNRPYSEHNANLNNITKIQVIKSIFSNHNKIKSEINDIKAFGQSNIWKINNVFLNNL